MPGFTSRDDIINEVTVNGKQDVFNFYKLGAAPEAAGTWYTFWVDNGQPGAGSAPAGTPGAAYDSDSTSPVSGSMFFPDRSTDQRYLLSFGAVATQNCTLMLYDRLVGVGAVSTSTTGNKTVNSAALTRYTGTSGILNEAWIEVTTALTTTVPNIDLVSYTAADSSTGNAGPAFTLSGTATIAANAMYQLPLAANKQGVIAIATLDINTASAAGAVNVLIIRPLARIPLLANVWNEVSFLDDTMGLPRVYDNACLAVAMLASGTTATNVWGTVNCAYG